MYDWANSAYTTSVITVFLGPFLTSIALDSANKNGFVNIFGVEIYANSLFAYTISLSVIFQFIFMPIIGAIADKLGNNKFLLGLFTYIGAIATFAMFYIDDNGYTLGALLLIISNVCFGIAIVLYNSYISYISDLGDRDKTSSIGWAVGYLGAAFYLGLNLFFVQNAAKYNLSTGDAVRFCLMGAGIWWALFSLFPLIGLKSLQKNTKFHYSHILSSFKEIKNTLISIKKHKITFNFFIAYLLYNDGVQAVIALAAVYGSQELKLGNEVLIKAILLVQFVAFVGSLLFNFLSQKFGNKNSLILSVFIWIIAIFYAYQWLYTESDFYLLSVIIGVVLGGTQAISRSIFSQLIPTGKEAEYFSFYELTDRGTSWFGTLLFGLSLQYTQSYRLAILSLLMFFIMGIIVLIRTNINKGIEEITALNNLNQ